MNESRESRSGHTVAASHLGLNRTIARRFFGLGCAMALAGAAVYAGVPLPLDPDMKALLIGGCLLLAMGFLAAMALLRHAAPGVMVMTAGSGGALIVVLTAVGLGEGIHSVSLGYLGLIVCLVSVLTSVRAAVMLAAGCAVMIGALGWAEHIGMLPGPMAVMRTPELVNLLTHGMVLSASVMAGVLLARLVSRAMSSAAERERRFRNLLLIAADWYWELDADLRFSRIDDNLLVGTRDALDERLGRHPWDVDDLVPTGLTLDQHRLDLEAHRPFSDMVVRRRSRSGRISYFSISGRPRVDIHGAFNGYWGVGRDITAEVQARDAQAASESRYQELFSLSPTPLVLHRDGITLLANDAAAQLFGFASAQRMNGFDIVQLCPAAQRARLHEHLLALSALPVGRTLAVSEFQMQAVDSRRLIVQASAVRVEAPDGPAGLSMFYDVTERVRTDTALRRTQGMLTQLFATSPDFITLSDMETGVYVIVNQGYTRMFGYTSEEVVGKSAIELGIWADLSERRRMVSDLVEKGGVNEIEALFVHKSGRHVPLLMSAAKFSMDGRDYLVTIGRDVSEAQRARLEHEAILKNASIGIALTRNQRFMQANPAFERMLGWGPGELIGKPGQVVWADEAEYAELGAIAAPLLSQGQPVALERQMSRRDGSRFWCRLLAQVVDPLRPSVGGTIWIAEDVTERRQIEQALATARDTAEAANRAKSAFLANTSHEIRTPLNGLLGLASLALQADLDDQRRQQYLRQILDSAQSLAGIISDILDLSKIEAGKLSVESVAFDLHALLKVVHHAYQSLAQAHALAMTLELADDVPVIVRGDPVRLRQILSNYITNALKFTARGRVRISVARSTDLAQPDALRFTVSDTGLGIDEATQARLFRPFTQADDSTTRRFGGTGLGLSICKELATLMGGHVGVDSRVGEGSCFWAELPLPETAAPPIDPGAEARGTLVGMRVLLVEDNAVNMMIGVAMLERWGVVVEQAFDGQEAIQAVERAWDAGRPFHAVLMDVQMPRLSGHEAARTLRLRHAPQSLPIVALTAAALVSEREEALAAGMDDFLTKPVDEERLRQVLVRIASRHAT